MISSNDLVVVSPDVEGVARARGFAKKLSDAPLAIVDKRRQGHNVSEVMNLIGDVKGKVAVLMDDMIDTAGELISLVYSNFIGLFLFIKATSTVTAFTYYSRISFLRIFVNIMINKGTIASAAALLHQEGAWAFMPAVCMLFSGTIASAAALLHEEGARAVMPAVRMLFSAPLQLRDSREASFRKS